MRRRLAVSDFLAPQSEHVLTPTAEAKVGLVDLGASRVDYGGAISDTVFASVVVALCAKHADILHLQISAEGVVRCGLIAQSGAQGRGVSVFDSRDAVVDVFKTIAHEKIRRPAREGGGEVFLRCARSGQRE